jgi:hypothetical protein
MDLETPPPGGGSLQFHYMRIAPVHSGTSAGAPSDYGPQSQWCAFAFIAPPAVQPFATRDLPAGHPEGSHGPDDCPPSSATVK